MAVRPPAMTMTSSTRSGRQNASAARATAFASHTNTRATNTAKTTTTIADADRHGIEIVKRTNPTIVSTSQSRFIAATTHTPNTTHSSSTFTATAAPLTQRRIAPNIHPPAPTSHISHPSHTSPENNRTIKNPKRRLTASSERDHHDLDLVEFRSPKRTKPDIEIILNSPISDDDSDSHSTSINKIATQRLFTKTATRVAPPKKRRPSQRQQPLSTQPPAPATTVIVNSAPLRSAHSINAVPRPASRPGNAAQLARKKTQARPGVPDPDRARVSSQERDTASAPAPYLRARETSEANDQLGGRKLRSQDATKYKSELSAYFPDYDEVIGNEPKERHLLNVETPILIVDSRPTHIPSELRAPLVTSPVLDITSARPAHTTGGGEYFPIRGYGDALFNDLFDSQRINFDFLGQSYKGKTLDDPLLDEAYLPVHNKAQRLEKSIRNTEKGRAQHEKAQIVRLLDGLQGHDWLRIMGVNGVTESKKRTFQPARQHFIRGCQAIIDKFRQWGLEEKRRKEEKHRSLAEEAGRSKDGSSDEGEEGADEEDDDDDDDDEDMDEEMVSMDSDDDAESERIPTLASGTPDETDVDAFAAKQLRDEAAARSKMAKQSRKRPRAATKTTTEQHQQQQHPVTKRSSPPPQPPPPPQKELKSFFKKRHERDAAMNKHRRGGRRVLAWGQPIPDMGDAEFDLPEEYLDRSTMTAHARKRRREMRGSRQ